MNITLSLNSLRKTFIRFLHRFHVMIFVFIVIGGVITLMLLLNGIIARSGESDGYVAPNANTATFDQATIKKIEDLKTRDQNSGQLDLSNGRTNPFVE